MKTRSIKYIIYIEQPESIKLIERLINWFKTILLDVCQSVEIIVRKKEVNISNKNKGLGLNKWLQ